jgi:membrane protease YdiL (CAAX protease family)
MEVTAATALSTVFSWPARRLAALALPLVIPPSMVATFWLARVLLGDWPGYLVAFLLYWGGWCLAVPLALLGKERVRALFADRRPRLGRAGWLGATLLLLPPLGAIGYRFIPEIGSATPAMLGTIAAVVAVNAPLEELLWRGVFVTFWPRSLALGYVYPAAGFALWHFAPQVIHPGKLHPAVFVASSLVLGLCWGWVAWRTGSLRWTTVSHFFTDGSGLRNALFFLPS